MNEEMNEKLEESGQMLDEPGAQQTDLPSQPKLLWYRRFSWCLLVSLILALIELGLICYFILFMPGIIAYFLSGFLVYGVLPFFFLLGAALCCNLAALAYWNRWTALVSALLYIQAGACLGLTTVFTAIPAGLCLISMGWSIKKGR
ncbi:DUF5336 domain-containing protein [Faecalibaculum rodentium]|uniref:Uncharacterized protein n=1 Tax=Faecalibaculum rodentium TaxID=1702221 RepID=A0A1Q9YI07_9FIRM|nr:DUF5336 domain-containing protein [Faecalibaculum rodentium]OLU43826.1 hypothetical protein BO223_10470 [Faecalibaculum rodentium]